MTDIPRYRQILETVRARLRIGRYPVGSQLPTEAEFCVEFGASRYTVREALRRLVEQGLLSRRQKSGTVVLASHSPSAFIHTVRNISDLFQLAVETSLEILDIREVDELPPGPDGRALAEGPWHRVDALRSEPARQRPISYVVAYVPARLSHLVPALRDVQWPLYAYLEQRAAEPVLRVIQEITAGILPARAARALDEPPHSIGVCMHRTYFSVKGVLIMSFSWHPAADFVYRTEFERSVDRKLELETKGETRGDCVA
jgi:DNA-binding GntR family transcriptional regulator